MGDELNWIGTARRTVRLPQVVIHSQLPRFLVDDLAHFRREIFNWVPNARKVLTSQGCVDRTSPNLMERTHGRHLRSPCLFAISDSLLHFQTRAAQRQMVSKKRPNFALSDPLYILRELSWQIIEASPTTEPPEYI